MNQVIQIIQHSPLIDIQLDGTTDIVGMSKFACGNFHEAIFEDSICFVAFRTSTTGKDILT